MYTIQEFYKNHLSKEVQVDLQEHSRVQQPKLKSTLSAHKLNLHFLYDAFLPEGFPDSVTIDYLPYQLWDSIQAMCSYVRGMLSTQAVLRGVGVGRSSATPLSAVFMFFVRDLTGMLAQILFAYWQGSQLDACAKQWRLFADFVNSVGLCLDLATGVVGQKWFLVLTCLGSVSRGLTGVAGGATRTALTMHFAKRGNSADVSAKEQSQETATTLIGMIVGMGILEFVSDRQPILWSIFVLLTLLHMYSNIKAVRSLKISSLNQPRIDILLQSYLENDEVPSPGKVAKLEPLLPPPILRLFNFFIQKPRHTVRMGSKLNSIDINEDILQIVSSFQKQEQYCVILNSTGAANVIFFYKFVSDDDLLAAYTQAFVAQKLYSKLVAHDSIQQAKLWMEFKFQSFLQQCQQSGWLTSKVRLMYTQYSVQVFKSDQINKKES